MAANRSIRSVIPALYIGIEKEETAVTETTMTRIGLTIPASTAACPMIRPPTIPIAGPIGLGKRRPASLKISIEISIINASINTEKGTPCLELIIEIANFVGINPGWNERKEIYSAGAKSDIAAAKKRKRRISDPTIQRSL
ncbi:hypothetical protein D3C78_1151300 [compost metagenome]